MPDDLEERITGEQLRQMCKRIDHMNAEAQKLKQK